MIWQRRRKSALLFTSLAFFGAICSIETGVSAYYSNVTLTSQNGDLEVVIFLPVGIKPTEKTYYASSRFEHGSMIGAIKRKTRRLLGDEVVENQHWYFGAENWRVPHNAQWPESGIGLASEFGVGDDGDFCQYRCGWQGVNDVTNGVLGYRDARNGEPFLKIGVGALIKGSCPTCDSTDNYRFNSPYEFAELPHWSINQVQGDVLAMEHEAVLREHGYRLHKDVVLDDNVLLVTSTLTNLGSTAFSTAWYSHNFFTCDGSPVGPGYELDMNIRGHRGNLYEEPGVIGSWAMPLQSFASVKEYSDHISVSVSRPLEGNTRIKAEFAKDSASTGGFTLNACGASIESDLPDVKRGDLPMYAYNLYLEKGTLSPEPQLLIHLEPGASKSWTQRLTIEDSNAQSEGHKRSFFGIRGMSMTNFSVDDVSSLASRIMIVILVVVITISVVGFPVRTASQERRANYCPVPDVSTGL